jgi:HK97 family phage major capsid protein
MPETTATQPEKLPKRFHFETIEIVPVARAAGDAAGADPSADGGAQDDVFHIVISTETPCDSYFGQEVMSHSQGAIDMSIARNGLSLYLEHGGYPYRPSPDPALHVGIVENIVRTDARRLEGDMRFSEHDLAQRAKQDVISRTLRFISVRALPLKRKVARSNDPNSPDTVTFTRWRPEEVSIVGIPADPNAGIARSAGAEEYAVETEYDAEVPETTSQEEPTMPEAITEPAAPASPATPAAPPAESSGVSVTRSAGAPPAEIVRLCASHNVPQARAAEFIEKGYSIEAAKAAIFDERSTRGVAAQPPSEVRLDGVPAKDRSRYSVARALQRATDAKEGNGVFDGLEAEVSQEIARQLPRTYRGIGGHFMPLSLHTPEERIERAARITRAMGSGVSGGGAELVFDTRGDLIELLVAQMLCSSFGAQTLMGLTGPVQFPVETGEPTAYFISENPANAAGQSQLTFGTRVLSPKEAVAVVPFPRRLLNLAAIDIESRARMRLISKHARLWDKMGLHGRGTDGEPTGIYNTPGVNTVAFGGTVPTYGKLVDLGGAIADANADINAMAYMTTPLMASKLKQTLDFGAVAGSRPIWDGTFRDGQMAGYRAGSTNQVSKTLGAGSDEHGIIFGDWSSLTFGHWGALEFIVDTVTLADKGQIKITTNELGDCLVERPEAFAVATAAKIA